MQSGFDLNDLVKEAHTRWLKPAEVYFILQNHEDHQLTHEAPQKPASGSVFLYNKRILRFFRRDGHSWRKKKDGRTVGEAHERLKVGNTEALNCYYAHSDLNPTFQRRSYWMLDPAYEHIVLVHYRDISEIFHLKIQLVHSSFAMAASGLLNELGFEITSCSYLLQIGSSSHLSPVSSLIQSPSSYTTQNPGSISVASRLHESFQNQSSPGSIEVSSELVSKEYGIDDGSSSELEVSQALRRIEVQLSLNDDSFEEMGPFFFEDENSNDLEASEYAREMKKECEAIVLGPEYNVHDIGHAGIQNGAHNFLLHEDTGDDKDYHRQSFQPEYTVDWKEVLDVSKNSSGTKAQETYLHSLDGNEKPLSSSTTLPTEDLESSYWLNFDGTYAENSSNVLPYDVDNFKFPTYSSEIKYEQETNHSYSTMLFDQSQIGMPLEADSSLTTISGNQKFKIREISPEWGYSSEVTKVIIVGSFLCNPSECAWRCMFGNIEVPIQIIQEGVILCQAPPQLPSKVTLCITSGNRESCSEIREFEYRVKTSSCARCDIPQEEVTKSPEELLLLVRFIQMLLSDPLIQKSESVESRMNNLKTVEDAWGEVIEALLVGSGASSSTMDWLLQELLKDKFQQWISSRSMQRCDQSDCLLSKKEQGIIHMVAGLGFEWALNPIINLGVGVNFRDINGWTALHWAARFGREKVVAALIASGASAGAVTDPNSQDPTGKTPASIAATSRHKGLAGYLSEVAVTTHLSSLKLEETELSKDSAELEAEIAVNTISNGSHTASTNEEQLSLKDTLAAVRNTAQAAARIQSAFRAHSFRKRQERIRSTGADEYGISSDDALALSKLTFRNVRDYNAAALSIQKKYRGWKGRKDFLAFRQKVVKIQAHVRGHQMRKNYKVICWAVGILDKVVLRWRRGGVGLRGFRHEEFIDESEDEDIVKVFRRQKVDASIDEAVSRVLSMVESPNARQQYRRMLEKYRQAKAELVRTTSEEATSTSQSDFFDLDKDDMFYQLP